jgi:hypothetical protein
MEIHMPETEERFTHRLRLYIQWLCDLPKGHDPVAQACGPATGAELFEAFGNSKDEVMAQVFCALFYANWTARDSCSQTILDDIAQLTPTGLTKKEWEGVPGGELINIGDSW